MPADAGRRIMDSLGIDPLDAQIRQVVFFDTPDLTLDKAGVVVRARRVQVGARRLDGQAAADRARQPSGRAAEEPELRGRGRRHPRRLRLLGIDEGSGSARASASVLHGDKPIKKLFTKEQRQFYAEHAPEGLDINDLSILGPINVFKLKWKPVDFPRKVVGRALELPRRVAHPRAVDEVPARRRVPGGGRGRAFLGSKGIETGGEQTTKTRTALEFFAKELKSQGQ